MKHEGILRRVANDLDVAYSTIKRWTLTDKEMVKVIKEARKIGAAKFVSRAVRKVAVKAATMPPPRVAPVPLKLPVRTRKAVVR